MKNWKFDQLVAARANANVQEKILKCKLKIINALREVLGYQPLNSLSGSHWGYYTNGVKECQKILSIMLSGNWTKDWPGVIWEAEKARVADEIIGMMQPMERALRDLERIPSANDCQPEGSREFGEREEG